MRAICFYLPQYHPTPENDAWWGKGFTDWVNVARARPRFHGHHQPHLPADLGFYDLRLEATRIAQAELAAASGIDGFCYYHYWFNGKALLGTPFSEVLASGTPDFPFCLAWANESWTRSWDGLEKDVLLAQEYSSYDPDRHIDRLSRAFRDERHIRIGDRPLFLVYNPSAIPDLARTVERWRARAGKNGVPGLYLSSVMSHRNTLSPEAARAAGFDAVVEFFPHPRVLPAPRPLHWLRALLPRAWNRLADRLPGRLGRRCPRLPSANVYSYRRLIEKASRTPAPAVRTFPCVFPSWDNTPRRKRGATVIQNLDPAPYGEWLRRAGERALGNPPGEDIVFINAWNEWAEGCHLEPDLRTGRAFLDETRKVVEASGMAGAPGLAQCAPGQRARSS